MSIFEHRSIDLPDCKFLISPSQLAKFYENPALWYKEEIEHDRQFKGNTSTVLGTICHYIYECVTEGKEVTRDIINKELFQFLADNPELADEVDVDAVKVDYPLVSAEVVNSYILPMKELGTKSHSETSLAYKLRNGIYAAGTCDRIEEDDDSLTIVDFKTVAKKPSELVIPDHYKRQLMCYAYMARETFKKPIDKIRIVYGVRPQKTIGARCIEVSEQVTDELWEMIDHDFKLISDTFEACERDPNLIYLIFKDYGLKRAA